MEDHFTSSTRRRSETVPLELAAPVSLDVSETTRRRTGRTPVPDVGSRMAVVSLVPLGELDGDPGLPSSAAVRRLLARPPGRAGRGSWKGGAGEVARADCQ